MGKQSGKGEEEPVEEGSGGKQSYLCILGAPSPQRLTDEAERSPWVRPQARPAQEGRFLAGLTNAHSVPSELLPYSAIFPDAHNGPSGATTML